VLGNGRMEDEMTVDEALEMAYVKKNQHGGNIAFVLAEEVYRLRYDRAEVLDQLRSIETQLDKTLSLIDKR
jgi:hypothetical protein